MRPRRFKNSSPNQIVGIRVQVRDSIPVSVSPPLLFHPGTPPEHSRIHRGHVATPQGHRRDEMEHTSNMLQRGVLPVRAVATAAHGPGDEGCSGHRRQEDDGGESRAISESSVADLQGVRECDGGDATAANECTVFNSGQSMRE